MNVGNATAERMIAITLVGGRVPAEAGLAEEEAEEVGLAEEEDLRAALELEGKCIIRTNAYSFYTDIPDGTTQAQSLALNEITGRAVCLMHLSLFDPCSQISILTYRGSAYVD